MSQELTDVAVKSDNLPNIICDNESEDKTTNKNVSESCEYDKHLPNRTINDPLLPNQSDSETNALNKCLDLKIPLSDEADVNTNSLNQENITVSEELEINKEFITNLAKNLASSSVSLNDHNFVKESLITCNSPLSRSAENICINNAEYSGSNQELYKDKILTEFNSKKSILSATQKLPTEQYLQDLKSVKLNKELIAQDFGYIVKNVHGIFSSVSGSLKNAYGMSQKGSQMKLPIQSKTNVSPKNLVNGKIINDIFEDNALLEQAEEPILEEAALIDKPTSPMEMLIVEENNSSKDIVKLQVESLEKMLAEQRKEIAVLRERERQHAEELKDKDLTFRDMEGKMDLMCKRVEYAEREKDLAVMRYASGECAIIEAKKIAQTSQKAEQNALSEIELLNNKLKTAYSEKHRICQLYDDKCHELQNSERELAKQREDLKELDGRLKWTQSKLRLEIDVNKECSERADKLTLRITELEAAKEAAVINAADSLRAKQLESDLKECRASLILCRHEKEDLERRFSAVSQHLELCKNDLEHSRSNLAEQCLKVKQLEDNNCRLEEEAASLAALRAQASLADTLAVQLERESKRANETEQLLQKELAKSETCSRREAAALQHAASLTAGAVAHHAACRTLRDQAQALSADNVSLREQLSRLEEQLTNTRQCLTEECDRRNKENRVLARRIAELTEEVKEANKKLEWEKGENCVLKKKHSSAIKELNRELQRALKRCEHLELKHSPSEPDASIRTGSISSLSSSENVSTHTEDKIQNGHATEIMPDIQVKEPDKQALIERIVSLQRAAARRSERCDFLEEHSRQLTAELRKKSRVLRQLMLAMPTGALAGSSSDQHKKEIARLGGGAMAAVWGGDSAGMSLELSVEMNRRLQAVLEDTLLNNITLKENMDTLGEEISRLKSSKLNVKNEDKK